jgi:hypothetical protein
MRTIVVVLVPVVYTLLTVVFPWLDRRFIANPVLG